MRPALRKDAVTVDVPTAGKDSHLKSMVAIIQTKIKLWEIQQALAVSAWTLGTQVLERLSSLNWWVT